MEWGSQEVQAPAIGPVASLDDVVVHLEQNCSIAKTSCMIGGENHSTAKCACAIRWMEKLRGWADSRSAANHMT